MNGDITLRIEGLMLDRLLARAMEEGAVFCRVRRSSARTIELRTDPKSAAILTALCEKFSISCKVLSRSGKNAFLRRLKNRITLLSGIISCMICMSLFFSRIWIIDIESDDERGADPQWIQDALESIGVHPGMPIRAIDADLLADQLAAAIPEFSFVGVRLQGVRLLIETASAIPEPDLYNIENARDLVAACDGIVLFVNVQFGNACVSPGDTVTRGQILIEGTERSSKEENREIAALGSVVARAWVSGEAVLPTSRTQWLQTGRSSVSSDLRLLQFSYPLISGESYSHSVIRTEILPIGGLFLPLEICRTTLYETQPHIVREDEAALRAQLARLALADAGARLSIRYPNGCEIADQWIEYWTDMQKNMHARAVYETHIDIAVPRGKLYQQGG